MSKTKKLARARRVHQDQVEIIRDLERQLVRAQNYTRTAEQERDLCRETAHTCERSMAFLAHYLIKARPHKASVLMTLMRMAQPQQQERIFEEFPIRALDERRDYYHMHGLTNEAMSLRAGGEFGGHGGFSTLTKAELHTLAMDVISDDDLLKGRKGMILRATLGGSRGVRQCYMLDDNALRFMPLDVMIPDFVAEMLGEIRKAKG